MKTIEQLLENLPEAEAAEDREKEMSELEKRRIYDLTMKKIKAEKKESGGAEREWVDRKNSMPENNSEIGIGEKNGKVRKWFHVTAAAVAAVCVVGALSITAAAAFGLDDSIRNFFGISGEKESQQAEKLTTIEEASAEDNGVKLTLTQVIGDKTRFYAVVKAAGIPDTSEALEFEENQVKVAGTDEKNIGSTVTTQMNGVDGDVTTFSVLVSDINENGEQINIDGRDISLALKNIGYRDADDRFVPVVKGKWKLDWKFSTDASDTVKQVGENIKLMDSDAVWKDITISPLSLTVHYRITRQGKEHFSEKEWAAYEKSVRLTIDFTDGTRMDSRFADDVDDEWGSTEQDGYKTIGFKKIADAKEIASVSFGGRTVQLNNAVSGTARTTVTGKAARCTVSVPADLKKILSMENKYNVKNADTACKESYTIFWGTKNNVKMPLFTLHRFAKEFSQDELLKKNPMLVFIDTRGGFTYAIEYGEIQSEEQQREFPDILNRYIAGILPFTEIQ